MANPSESSVQTQIGQAFLALDELDRKLVRDVTNPTSERIDEMIQGLEGDYSSASAAGVEAFRSFCSGTVASSVGQSMADGHILDYGKVLSLPEGTVGELLERIRQDFQKNSKTVQTRSFVFQGVPTPGGGNTGTGELVRLTVDEGGFPLEAATPETKNARCISDAASGSTVNQEQFEFGGDNPPKDNVAGFRSPDRLGVINAINADNSQTYIQNPTFGQPVIPAETDLARYLPGWTLTNAIANVTSRTDTFYRGASIEGTTPACIEVNADETIFQEIATSGGSFDFSLPYYSHIAFRLANAAVGAGTLTLTLGSASVVFDLSTISDTNWRIIKIPADQKAWFKTFNQADLKMSLVIAGLGGNPVLLDDITVENYDIFDGTFWAFVGGETPFVTDDTFSLLDTAGPPEAAIIQYWLWRTYGFYLPSSGTPTWTEPVV